MNREVCERYRSRIWLKELSKATKEFSSDGSFPADIKPETAHTHILVEILS
jgi:hypothetical protein